MFAGTNKQAPAHRSIHTPARNFRIRRVPLGSHSTGGRRNTSRPNPSPCEKVYSISRLQIFHFFKAPQGDDLEARRTKTGAPKGVHTPALEVWGLVSLSKESSVLHRFPSENPSRVHYGFGMRALFFGLKTSECLHALRPLSVAALTESPLNFPSNRGCAPWLRFPCLRSLAALSPLPFPWPRSPFV